jgi:hypothetical protein
VHVVTSLPASVVVLASFSTASFPAPSAPPSAPAASVVMPSAEWASAEASSFVVPPPVQAVPTFATTQSRMLARAREERARMSRSP